MICPICGAFGVYIGDISASNDLDNEMEIYLIWRMRVSIKARLREALLPRHAYVRC